MMKNIDKIQDYKKASQKILTYLDVRNMFNALGKNVSAVGAWYGFFDKITNREGQQTCGFKYTGFVAGVGLRNVLDDLGIKYYTYMASAMNDGVNEESEIYIDVKDKDKMLDIYRKIGQIDSNVRVDNNPKESNFLEIMKEMSKQIGG